MLKSRFQLLRMIRPVVPADRSVSPVAEPLAFSRRAQELQITLAQPDARTAFESACMKVVNHNLIDEIDSTLTAVFERQTSACERLLAICEKLKPLLPHPPGRKQSRMSPLTKFTLAYVGRCYTTNPDSQEFVDAATKATRVAFDNANFDRAPLADVSGRQGFDS